MRGGGFELSMSLKHRYKFILRAVSAVLITAFGFGDIAAAAPASFGSESLRTAPGPGPAALLVDLVRNPSLLTTPSDELTVRETHAGTNGKLILHIQDPHTNFSGQKSLAAGLAGLLDRYAIDRVLVEGADRDVSLDGLRVTADLEVWKRIAYRELMKGRIAGEEYLNLISDRPMRILGIENMRLYDEALVHYAAMARDRGTILEDIRTMRLALDRIKLREYPKDLLVYESGRTADSDPDAAARMDALVALAKGAQVGLGGFAAVREYLELKRREASIDFDRANAEQEALIGRLRAASAIGIPPVPGRQAGPAARYAFLRGLMETAGKLGVEAGRYPELERTADYLRAAAQIDAASWMEDARRLEEAVYQKLLLTPELRTVYAMDRFLSLSEAACRFRLSTFDYREWQELRRGRSSEQWLAFLNRRLLDLGYAENLVPNRVSLDRAAGTIDAFYRTVMTRDEAFVRRAAEYLEGGEEAQAAVLIAGGYHTQNLTRLLREAGYSYVVLMPRVEDTTDHKAYEKVLLADADAVVRKTIRPRAVQLSAARLTGLANAAGNKGNPVRRRDFLKMAAAAAVAAGSTKAAGASAPDASETRMLEEAMGAGDWSEFLRRSAGWAGILEKASAQTLEKVEDLWAFLISNASREKWAAVEKEEKARKDELKRTDLSPARRAELEEAYYVPSRGEAVRLDSLTDWNDQLARLTNPALFDHAASKIRRNRILEKHSAQTIDALIALRSSIRTARVRGTSTVGAKRNQELEAAEFEDIDTLLLAQLALDLKLDLFTWIRSEKNQGHTPVTAEAIRLRLATAGPAVVTPRLKNYLLLEKSSRETVREQRKFADYLWNRAGAQLMAANNHSDNPPLENIGSEVRWRGGRWVPSGSVKVSKYRYFSGDNYFREGTRYRTFVNKPTVLPATGERTHFSFGGQVLGNGEFDEATAAAIQNYMSREDGRPYFVDIDRGHLIGYHADYLLMDGQGEPLVRVYHRSWSPGLQKFDREVEYVGKGKNDPELKALIESGKNLTTCFYYRVDAAALKHIEEQERVMRARNQIQGNAKYFHAQTVPDQTDVYDVYLMSGLPLNRHAGGMRMVLRRDAEGPIEGWEYAMRNGERITVPVRYSVTRYQYVDGSGIWSAGEPLDAGGNTMDPLPDIIEWEDILRGGGYFRTSKEYDEKLKQYDRRMNEKFGEPLNADHLGPVVAHTGYQAFLDGRAEAQKLSRAGRSGPTAAARQKIFLDTDIYRTESGEQIILITPPLHQEMEFQNTRRSARAALRQQRAIALPESRSGKDVPSGSRLAADEQSIINSGNLENALAALARLTSRDRESVLEDWRSDEFRLLEVGPGPSIDHLRSLVTEEGIDGKRLFVLEPNHRHLGNLPSIARPARPAASQRVGTGYVEFEPAKPGVSDVQLLWQSIDGDLQGIFPDGTFSLILAFNVLKSSGSDGQPENVRVQAYPVTSRAVQNMDRLLAPGGRLLVSDVSSEAAQALRSRFGEPYIDPQTRIYIYTKQGSRLSDGGLSRRNILKSGAAAATAALLGGTNDAAEVRSDMQSILEVELRSIRTIDEFVKRLPEWVHASRVQGNLAVDMPLIRARWDVLMTEARRTARKVYEEKDLGVRRSRERVIRDEIRSEKDEEKKKALYQDLAGTMDPAYRGYWLNHRRLETIAYMDRRLRMLAHIDWLKGTERHFEEERMRRGLDSADVESILLMRESELQGEDDRRSAAELAARKADAAAILKKFDDWEEVESAGTAWRLGVEPARILEAGDRIRLEALVDERLELLQNNKDGTVSSLIVARRRIRENRKQLEKWREDARYAIGQAAQAAITSANSTAVKVAAQEVGRPMILPGMAMGPDPEVVYRTAVRPANQHDPREYYDPKRSQRFTFFKVSQTPIPHLKADQTFVHLMNPGDLPEDIAKWLEDPQHEYHYFDPRTGDLYGRFMDWVILDKNRRFAAGVYFTDTEMNGNWPREIYPGASGEVDPELQAILTKKRSNPDRRIKAFRYLLPPSEIRVLEERRRQMVAEGNLHPDTKLFHVDEPKDPKDPEENRYVYFWDGEDLLRHAGGEEVLVVEAPDGPMRSLETRMGPDGKIVTDENGRRVQEVIRYRPTPYVIVSGTGYVAAGGTFDLVVEALLRERLMNEGGAMAFNPEYEEAWRARIERLVNHPRGPYLPPPMLNEVRYLKQTHIYTGLAAYLRWKDRLDMMVHEERRRVARMTAEERSRSDFSARVALWDDQIFRNEQGEFYMPVASPRWVERYVNERELEFFSETERAAKLVDELSVNPPQGSRLAVFPNKDFERRMSGSIGGRFKVGGGAVRVRNAEDEAPGPSGARLTGLLVLPDRLELPDDAEARRVAQKIAGVRLTKDGYAISNSKSPAVYHEWSVSGSRLTFSDGAGGMMDRPIPALQSTDPDEGADAKRKADRLVRTLQSGNAAAELSKQVVAEWVAPASWSNLTAASSGQDEALAAQIELFLDSQDLMFKKHNIQLFMTLPDEVRGRLEVKRPDLLKRVDAVIRPSTDDPDILWLKIVPQNSTVDTSQPFLTYQLPDPKELEQHPDLTAEFRWIELIVEGASALRLVSSDRPGSLKDHKLVELVVDKRNEARSSVAGALSRMLTGKAAMGDAQQAALRPIFPTINEFLSFVAVARRAIQSAA